MTSAHDSLEAALAAFQAELPQIGKGNTANVKSEKGSYSYQYADLSDLSPLVLPLLAKHGLSWSTRPMLTPDQRFVLRYSLRHTSQRSIEGDYPLPAPGSSPQVLGSAITYARRYSLCAVTGVAPGTDDDDAAAASQHRTDEPRNDVATEADVTHRLLAMLRRTCEQNSWSPEKVAARYATTHDGADLRAATAQQITSFRRELFAHPQDELRPSPADQATEPTQEAAPAERDDQEAPVDEEPSG